jgi:hypothetical protein
MSFWGKLFGTSKHGAPASAKAAPLPVQQPKAAAAPTAPPTKPSPSAVAGSETLPSGAFKYQVEEGGAINKLAVEHRMFSAGEGKALLVTFLSSPPTLRLAGTSDDFIEVTGRLTCHPPCFKTFPFEMEFSGASGGGEVRCPACSSGYGLGHGYRRIGDQWNGKIDETGFFFWFSPHNRGKDNEFVHALKVQNVQVKVVSEKASSAYQQPPRAPAQPATALKFKVGESVRITGLVEPLFATREGGKGRLTLARGPFGYVVKKYGAVGTITEVDEKAARYKVRFRCPENFSATGEGSGDFVNILLELDDRCLAPMTAGRGQG